jgi:hypothetical protein
MQSTTAARILAASGGDNETARHRESEWLSTVEAAAYAGGIGISTIRDACNRNALRHVRIGGGERGPIRTRKEWISDWLQRWVRGGIPDNGGQA